MQAATLRAAKNVAGANALGRCLSDIIFGCCYPRLDAEVSKKMNHLLKVRHMPFLQYDKKYFKPWYHSTLYVAVIAAGSCTASFIAPFSGGQGVCGRGYYSSRQRERERERERESATQNWRAMLDMFHMILE